VTTDGRLIFVVEMQGALSLAFEAAHEAQAAAFASAPWFTEALERYLHSKQIEIGSRPLRFGSGRQQARRCPLIGISRANSQI